MYVYFFARNRLKNPATASFRSVPHSIILDFSLLNGFNLLLGVSLGGGLGF
jgi:hypothetical protein